MKHLVFSGMQPSGQLHIGNYFGALQTWLKLQDDKDNQCIFGIVDLHALTEGPTPADLRQRLFDVAVDYLAAGLDPRRSIIMRQSWVPEHAELAWILNCVTPVSWLERVPTFKDKAQQYSQNINMGLLGYPVLMAADILLYNADIVPVGQDQLAHLELAREIARGFNSRYGQTLVEPQERITPTPKIMALTNPTKKMSKSLGPKAYLALADSPETIGQKIKSMVSATGNETKVIRLFVDRTKEISDEFGKKTGGFHSIIRSEEDLTTLHRQLGDADFRAFMAYYNFYMLLCIFGSHADRKRFLADLGQQKIQFAQYKELLRKKITDYRAFAEFRKRRTTLLKNPKKVAQILKDGSKQARQIAKKNLQTIKKKIGLA